MIRSVPANGADNVYCLLLGQNSVHGVMAGYSGFSVALVNNKVVYIPIDQLVKKLQAHGLASVSRTGVVAMTKGAEIYKQI